MRAANYAATLGIPDTRAVFFAFDADDAEQLRAEWAVKQMPVPLEVEEAPFRDIGDPLARATSARSPPTRTRLRSW